MKNFFTIRQASKSCGVSRATILRLENKGLLTPVYIDEQNGYRYYDNNNISAILQIKRFLNIGMSYNEILLYYQSDGSSPELLKRMEEKLSMVKRAYEEMKLRIDNKEQLRFEFVTLPDYICYVKECNGVTTDDKYQAMYDLYHEVIEKGYQPLACEPLFVINKRSDFIQGDFSQQNISFICCIPLEKESAPKEAVLIPSCKAFSCLYYGNYERLPQVYNEFGKKLRELGLKPIGNPRGLGLVAPYTGKNIPADNYVSRLVVPIAEFPD